MSEKNPVLLQHPFTMLICGPSKSGKSSFVLKLIELWEKIFEKPRGPVYYFYKIWADAYDEMRENGLVTEFIQGPCTSEWMEANIDRNSNATCIIDDQAGDMNKDIETIFTVTSHHMKTNVVFISQTTFSKNPSMRTVSQNCTYLVLMKNVRDLTVIRYLAQQVNPSNPKMIIDAYQQATKEPYTHFLFDFNQNTPNYLRYRSNILPVNDSQFQAVYM